MKKLQEMIKDLINVTVEQEKIDSYLENEKLDLNYPDLCTNDLRYANLINANLRNIKITKKQLEQLIVIEEDK